ncbi:uncharacterized protein LOC117122903 [Anneissia japonica]|uniref:uncharacterized protein LOC117122903 n=1 Tax=Anneissia japonica TaxID=1529436 RepID=UPI00142575CC|nr:uncharacterized protein LOC117122903 [Anneissia japonica]
MEEKGDGENQQLPDINEINVNAAMLPNPTNTIDTLINHCSSWQRLKRAVAWWLRLKTFLFQRAKGTPPEKKERLTVDELENAEMAIIRYIQHQEFAEEIRNLQSSSKSSRGTLLRLDPEL